MELVSLPESLEEGMAGVVGRAVSASRAGGTRLGGGEGGRGGKLDGRSAEAGQGRGGRRWGGCRSRSRGVELVLVCRCRGGLVSWQQTRPRLCFLFRIPG